jgi:hypothetical protein
MMSSRIANKGATCRLFRRFGGEGNYLPINKRVITDNYSAEKPSGLVKSEDLQAKGFIPRGRGGKNEIDLLPAINDAAVALNKKRPSKNAFEIISSPINLAGEPHLGIFMNLILKDIFIRYNLLQGKKVTNHLGNWSLPEPSNAMDYGWRAGRGNGLGVGTTKRSSTKRRCSRSTYRVS